MGSSQKCISITVVMVFVDVTMRTIYSNVEHCLLQQSSVHIHRECRIPLWFHSPQASGNTVLLLHKGSNHSGASYMEV